MSTIPYLSLAIWMPILFGVFILAFGRDRIVDFTPGEDIVEFETIPTDRLSADFSHLMIADGAYAGGLSGAVIDFGSLGALFLQGVAAADLDAADFRFTYV